MFLNYCNKFKTQSRSEEWVACIKKEKIFGKATHPTINRFLKPVLIPVFK